jgi:hypothetical protein
LVRELIKACICNGTKPVGTRVATCHYFAALT